MSNQITLYDKQDGCQIAPQDCGSTIFWHVRAWAEHVSYGDDKGKVRAFVSGTVHLTDCSRVISWDMCELEKIDAAIEQLRRARKALAKALAKRDAHKEAA